MLKLLVIIKILLIFTLIFLRYFKANYDKFNFCVKKTSFILIYIIILEKLFFLKKFLKKII